MFFSFDGVDGAGKTTQITSFVEWLRASGQTVVLCRDPGSTPLGEAVRRILLEPNGPRIDRRSEMLLYMASRAQLVDEIIRPALAAGQTVVCDRYLLANLVYQGHAGGLDIESIRRVGQVAIDGLEPDLTFVLDLAPEEAAKRLTRPRDRMESQGAAFDLAVREGFRREAQRDPRRFVRVDASQPVDVVQAEIRSVASRLLVQPSENPR
jgi:dTMP kinase